MKKGQQQHCDRAPCSSWLLLQHLALSLDVLYLHLHASAVHEGGLGLSCVGQTRQDLKMSRRTPMMVVVHQSHAGWVEHEIELGETE